jgi:EAL domain-containing protein (putative c-di-GMP-specific phosphodiesterase class I)/integral membrane sensor domain MASE1
LPNPATPPNASVSIALRVLLVAAAAFAACLVSSVVAVRNGAPLVWLPSGVALGFGWRYGPRWVLPASAGAAAFVAARYADPALAAACLLASACGPALAVAMLRRLSRWKPVEFRLDAVFRFALIVGAIAAPIDALLAAVGLSAAGRIPAGASAANTFFAWWLVDSLGMLLLAPAILAIFREPFAGTAQTSEDPATIDVPAVVASLCVAAASLALLGFGLRGYAHALLFFFFPIVAWMAVRNAERAAVLTLLCTALPLLGVSALSGRTVPAAALPFEGAILMLSAVLVALLLQAAANDRRIALSKVARQARHDLTTGLLNDRGLMSVLADRLAAPDRPHYGLIGLHIANFDTLHDLCGASQTLQLEQNTALLLGRQPGAVQAARLSSGRYALFATAENVSQVRALAREVYSALNGQVFKTENGSLRLQASVGGLLIDRHATIDGEDCLLSLSDAMAISASVRDPQLFVEPLSQTMIDARRSHQGKIEHIREAIRLHRMEIHAQPIVDPDAPAGSISYEILTRLRDRDGRMIRPPEFLPLAVQAQMTVALDRGVIRMVFEWLAANPSALARTHKCSLNLSGLTMSDSSIAGYIREQRATHRIPADKIVFEITESEAIRNPGAASRLVDDLKAEGFGIALDDFGTGLATFEYLKRFPIDYLKIDGSFIRNLMTNPIDEEIVLSTVRVARRLNVKTIAEHVHNRDIYDRLVTLGVEYIQGELIGTPIPLAQIFGADARLDSPAAGIAEILSGEYVPNSN